MRSSRCHGFSSPGKSRNHVASYLGKIWPEEYVARPPRWSGHGSGGLKDHWYAVSLTTILGLRLVRRGFSDAAWGRSLNRENGSSENAPRGVMRPGCALAAGRSRSLAPCLRGAMPAHMRSRESHESRQYPLVQALPSRSLPGYRV